METARTSLKAASLLKRSAEIEGRAGVSRFASAMSGRLIAAATSADRAIHPAARKGAMRSRAPAQRTNCQITIDPVISPANSV